MKFRLNNQLDPRSLSIKCRNTRVFKRNLTSPIDCDIHCSKIIKFCVNVVLFIIYQQSGYFQIHLFMHVWPHHARHRNFAHQQAHPNEIFQYNLIYKEWFYLMLIHMYVVYKHSWYEKTSMWAINNEKTWLVLV